MGERPLPPPQTKLGEGGKASSPAKLGEGRNAFRDYIRDLCICLGLLRVLGLLRSGLLHTGQIHGARLNIKSTRDIKDQRRPVACTIKVL